MLKGLLWLFDDPISDLLLSSILVVAAMHHRQMRLMQQRTDQLALQMSELKVLLMTMSTGFSNGHPAPQHAPFKHFDEMTLSN
jgi:hypothetical protein